MQVTQLDRNDNYALIGGSREGTFSLNATAYTFKVLYDTLYSDKEMAVVRELMANCYDAMKMAGRPNDPFSVTLTEKEVIFEDSGPGIPHDKMASIFCTMFGSSKTDDPTQIGGFGLGCKSPFALTDHFTVTSYHGGFQVVYAMHRGDETTNGIPGFREMVRVPCAARTGLTVTVPIKDSSQRNVIENNVKAFARWAGMNVLFKSTWKTEPYALPTFDLTHFNKVGFAVFNYNPQHLSGSIFVSLGNVLYPLETRIKGFLEMERMLPHGCCFVIRAEPGQVGVVPSREAISYTEQTTEYLEGLVARWSKNMEKMIEEERYLDLFRRFKTELKGDLFRLYELSVSNHGSFTRDHFACGRHEAAKFIAARRNEGYSDKRTEDVSRLLRHVLPSELLGRVGVHPIQSGIRGDRNNWYRHNAREMLKRAQMFMWTKRLNRVVRQIPGALLYGVNNHGTPIRATKTVGCTNRKRDETAIFVSERVKAIDEELSNSRGFGIDGAPNWSIIVPKLTNAVTEHVAQLLARIGMEPLFVRVEKAVPKPREPKVERPKDKYVSVVPIDDGYYDSNGNRVFPLAAGTIEAPAFYLDVPTRRSSSGRPRGPIMPQFWSTYAKELNALYPNTIIPDSAKDRKFCETNKVPSVIKTMQAELKAYSTKAIDYQMILAWCLETRPENRRVTHEARRVMINVIKKRGVEKLFSTYDQDFAVTDDHERCWHLAKLCWNLRHMNRDHDTPELSEFCRFVYGLNQDVGESAGGKVIKNEMPERYNLFDPESFAMDGGVYQEMFDEVLAFIDTKFKTGVAA